MDKEAYIVVFDTRKSRHWCVVRASSHVAAIDYAGRLPGVERVVKATGPVREYEAPDSSEQPARASA